MFADYRCRWYIATGGDRATNIWISTRCCAFTAAVNQQRPKTRKSIRRSPIANGDIAILQDTMH